MSSSNLGQFERPIEFKSERVSLKLIRTDNAEGNRFWVSFFRPGQHPANVVCSGQSLENKVLLSSKQGFVDTNPVMITDTSDGSVSYLLCFPHKPEIERSPSMREVVKAICGWSTDSVSLHVCEHLFGKDAYLKVLEKIISYLIESGTCHTINILSTDNQTCELLDVLSAIKFRFDYLDCDIYH